MARLPIPGSDGDTWGALLNEFLRVAHREDGGLWGVVAVVNVKDFGAMGDGSTDDTAAIQNAVAAATHALFFPAGTYRITAAILFPVVIQFAPGARLKPDTNVIVTLNQAILAPQQAVVFDLSNSGKFLINWTGELIANWWSGSDIGMQINNLFASINLNQPNPYGRTARVKIIGDADLLTPINMTNLRPIGGLVVTMEGRLVCKVGEARPAVDMVGSRNITAMNWSLYGDGAVKSGIGILGARTSNSTTPDPNEEPPDPKSAGNHKFINLQLAGDWKIAPIYLIDTEYNYFQNVDIRTQSSQYGFFFGGKNVENVASPYLPIDDNSSQTNLHIDGLYMQAKRVTKGGFYISGADRIHLSGQSYIHTTLAPKIVLDMTNAGISGFWCDGLHGEGDSSTGIHVIGSGKRLANVFLRTLGLGATEKAIHIDAARSDGSTGQLFVRNAHFAFLDIAAFHCSGEIHMEQQVTIVTSGDEQAPAIILTGEFNGEIYGGDFSKQNFDACIMRGRYYDGVHNSLYEFGSWPIFAFGDKDTHPNVSGKLRCKTANTVATVIANFVNAQLGQELTILFDDANTTLQHSANIVLQGGIDFLGKKGDVLTLVKMGAGFVEKSRSLTIE